MNRFQSLVRRQFQSTGSGLDRLIAPEIKNDAFYRMIIEVAATPGVRNILEIGSSSGDGSTEAFVEGIRRNPGSAQLHCLEISRVRFASLAARYDDNPAVRCYNLSSVPLDRFPAPAEVERFYRGVRTRLNRVPLETVLGWLRQDIEYLSRHGRSSHGIRAVKELNGIDTFDAVLIDGSEFTGAAELNEVYGARYLLLDDIRTYKNHFNHKRLSQDPSYRCLAESRRLRNGFAVFERFA